MEEEQGAQELGITEGFLEEVMYKQRLEEWEAVSWEGAMVGAGTRVLMVAVESRDISQNLVTGRVREEQANEIKMSPCLRGSWGRALVLQREACRPKVAQLCQGG